MAVPELISRLDRVEAELRALEAEVEEVRRLALGAGVQEVTPAEAIGQAWAQLERRRASEAIESASVALRLALAQGDERVLAEVASFARLMASQPIGAMLRAQVDDLAARAVRAGAEPAPEAAEPSREAVAPPAPGRPLREAAPPAAAVAPQRLAAPVAAARKGPSAGQRLIAFAASELSGGRAFALAGGVVTLLGIVFLFVLAANRGWIGPGARVSMGAAASLAVLLGGVVLRVRYGRMQASLAAVGAGIAGAYTTLAAATIIYAFLPSWGALLVAAAIAATGGGLAWRWRSQILAGLSLVGAAAAPGLVALDEGIGAAGTAFALVVLAAALVVGAARRWFWLAAAVSAVALAQVAWLTVAATAGEAGPIAVAAAAAFLLLGGAPAWQASASSEGLDLVASLLALTSGGLALGTLTALLPSNRDAGVALAIATLVYAVGGFVVARRWRDLGWVIGAVALVLAGVATSLVFSVRSLTVAWAVEAAALAVPAWRLRLPRLELASLAYLALGIVHLLTIDIWIDRPTADLAGSTTPSLYVLAAAALVAGTLVIDSRRDSPSTGILAGLEPLWDGIVATRGTLRFCLYALAVFLSAFGTAALLSERWLTLVWVALAVALGATARMLGERRVQAASLTLLALAVVHALRVEAPPDTLWLARGLDPLWPAPSVAALAAACAALAVLTVFRERGIAFLGPLRGAECSLASIGRRASTLRAALLIAAASYALWAAGLLFIHASYGPGQVAATGVWAAAGTGTAALAARRRSLWLASISLAPTAFAFGKATAFDWHELGNATSATALLLAAAGVLLVGFFSRYAASASLLPVEFGSLATTVVAVVSALVAIDRVAPDRPVLGAAALGVAYMVGGLAVPPFRAWRSGRPEKWLRDFATVYWAPGLLTLAFAEWELVAGSRGATVVFWALSAAVVATASGPLGENRFWLAGVAGAAVSAVVCLALVTVPSHLVVSSAHPGAGLWALAVCVASLGWIARLASEQGPRARVPIMLSAVALAVFGLSLGVLEIAERVSGASIVTDFQRGHTAVSALWGLLALALFVLGLIRSEPTQRRIGLALFGVALAKLFLYDLSNLSSITRALSFLAVGALLLTAAFFVERIIHGGGRGGHGGHAGPRTA